MDDVKFHSQWSEKGSYREEQMLETISHLPNRLNMFTQKNYAIYVLDDYAVHLMPSIRKKLLERGYILIIIGGGITGDIQVDYFEIILFLQEIYNEVLFLPISHT